MKGYLKYGALARGIVAVALTTAVPAGAQHHERGQERRGGNAATGAAIAQSSPGARLPPARQSFFETMDVNKDGVVTRAEVTGVLGKRFAAFDNDRNGVISQTEWQAQRNKRFDERFAAMDTDRNGQLSRSELRTAESRMGEPGEESAVTKDAFMKRSLILFEALDSNKDGRITSAEHDAALPRGLLASGPIDRAPNN